MKKFIKELRTNFILRPYFIFKEISFWGIIFLLIFTICFGIGIGDIYSEAVKRDSTLSFTCLYLLFSLIIWPVITIPYIVYETKSLSLPLFGNIIFEFYSYLSAPFKGIDAITHILPGGREIEWKEIDVYLYNIIRLIIFWSILFSGIESIILVKECRINTLINNYSPVQILRRIILIILVYLLCYVGIGIANIYDLRNL